MKKIFVSIVIALTMVASSFALDFSIGAKGLLSTNLDPDSEISYSNVNASLKTDSIYDGGFGIFANFALFGLLGVQAEANFSKYNVDFKPDIDYMDTSIIEYDSFIMDIPVMLWLNLKVWKIAVGAGAGVNFSTELKSPTEDSGYIDQVKNNKFNIGFVTGADLKIYFTKHLGLVMGGRYTVDLNKRMVEIDVTPGIDIDVPGVKKPVIEFTRKNLCGNVGLEFKFF